MSWIDWIHEERPCTCYPDEALRPCPRKYAYSECLEAARKARFHIQCPEWPFPCPFRTCETLNRCLAVMPLTQGEKDDLDRTA